MTTVGKFGVELECYDVPMEDVVFALTQRGIPTVRSCYMGRNYDLFQIKSDGSIQGNNGFEVVSPILEGEEGIQTIRTVCDIIKGLGGKVNKSTGFHVHHDVNTWGIKEFRNLYKRFAKFETAMDSIQPASRRENNNRYIASLYKVVAQTNGSSHTAQQELVKQIDSCRSVRQLRNLFGTRYLKLNLESFFRQGSVEFRHHSGTVEADKVENYIRLTYAMVADAKDHTAVKAYAKEFTAKESLETMLAGMVRRAKITKQVADFYKARATTLEGVE